MRSIVLLVPVAFLAASCATNPLSTARYWTIEQCAGLPNSTVRFLQPDNVTTLAVVPRANCETLQAAERKIEQQANQPVDHVYITNLEEINAFATLDKNGRPVVIVNMGMLKALGADEDAWAALTGHEIAHLVRRHREGREDAQKSARATGQAVGNVLAQLMPGVGGFLAGNAANFATTNAMYGAFTRPQEAEADELGLQWMTAAGYDANGMVRLFDLLGKQPTLPTFLSTHPASEDRGRLAREYAARHPAGQPATARSSTPTPAAAVPTAAVQNTLETYRGCISLTPGSGEEPHGQRTITSDGEYQCVDGAWTTAIVKRR